VKNAAYKKKNEAKTNVAFLAFITRALCVVLLCWFCQYFFLHHSSVFIINRVTDRPYKIYIKHHITLFLLTPYFSTLFPIIYLFITFLFVCLPCCVQFLWSLSWSPSKL
jgi:O-antigen/teichoic acid export membrane protein